MKRKDYERPTMNVVKLQHRNQILTGSPYTMSAGGEREQLTDGTDDLGWGSSSSRSGGNNWDEENEEEF